MIGFIRRLLLPAFAACALAGLAARAQAPVVAAKPTAVQRPPVARKEPRTFQVHGDTITDDYYWLRNKGTPAVEAYLKAELAYAEAFMKPTASLQQRLYDEMLSRIQQTDTNVPYRDHGYFYYSRTEEGKQYAIHCRKKGSLEAAEEVILDVNALAEGKAFMAVDEMAVSPDGSLLAYTTDETGFRQYMLHVKDLRTGRNGPEAIERVTSLAWAGDGKTVVYSIEHPLTKRSYQVLRHALGAVKDDLVYEEKDERFDVGVSKSRDDKYLFVDASSHTTSEIRYLPANDPAAEPKIVAPRIADQEYDVDHREGFFSIRTNDKGRNFRLVIAPVSDPSRANWKEIVPHRDDVMLAGQSMFKDFYVLVEREGGLPAPADHRLSRRQVASDRIPRGRLPGHSEQQPRVRHRAVPVCLPVAHHVSVHLRLRPGHAGAHAPEAGRGARRLRQVALQGGGHERHRGRRREGADVAGLSKGPRT